MRLPRFEYVSAGSVKECLTALQESGKQTRLLAGGTDLLVNMKYRVTCPERLVGIRSVPELCSISEVEGGNLRIGACVTLTDLLRHPLVSERCPALCDAIRSVASKHIRNMATIGGNICLPNRCWYYNQSKLWRDALTPCLRDGGTVCHAVGTSKRCHAINNSDTAPILIALHAQISIAGRDGEKVIPISKLFSDDGEDHTVLEPDEILTALIIPESSLSQTAVFIKVSDRKGLDFANGSIAASTAGNRDGTSVMLVINSLISDLLTYPS